MTLRNLMITTYGKCIISGADNTYELQVAHIIPKYIGHYIKTLTNTDYNCLLLSTGLHILFDNFQWTFDVFSLLDSEPDSDQYFNCKILVYSDIPSSVQEYNNETFRVPVKCFSSLYAHYMVYLRVNYTSGARDYRSITRFYRECMEGELFQQLVKLDNTHQIYNYISDLRSCIQQQLCIVDHCSSYYKIIWNLWSWKYSTWLYCKDINFGLFQEYHRIKSD